MTDIIYQDSQRRLAIQVRRTCTPDMVSFLEETVWGTRGVLYTKHNLAATLEGLPAPRYFSLTEGGRLVAVGVCLQKIVRAGQGEYVAIYPAALAVDEARRSQGYGKLMVEAARPYLLEVLGPTGLFYGFVESGNIRSLGLFSQVSTHTLGLFHTQIFSRFFPQDDRRVGPARESERQGLLAGLHDCYADHALLDFADSFHLDQYFVLREGGEVVAGVQAEAWEWSLLSLPGPWGFLLVRMLPRVPFLKRWFNAKELRFLKLGNLYARPGREAELFSLMEALLARHRVHFAMAYFDRRSPVYQAIEGAGDFGYLSHSLVFSAQVMAEFVGLGEEETADFLHRPLFISPLDAI
jgi:GNAT superfamily N-acetyltransferase